MRELFDRTKIKTMVLQNRFVRSATWTGLAQDDGSCSPELTDMMVELAAGGVGLIITGHAYVMCSGKISTKQLGICSNSHIGPLRAMTEAVHGAGGRIVLQLNHGGCFSKPDESAETPSGPSVLKRENGPMCREMTYKDISEVIEAFVKGAIRAQQAGFDGVQIHAAHGYLLSQFLSPFFNVRTDDYGGSCEKRTQMVLDILAGIRSSVGEDFPVLIKLNSEDFLEGGFSIDEMVRVSGILEKHGIDAIELSGGTGISGRLNPVRRGRMDSEAQEVYYHEAAKRFKKAIAVPLILVGGIRSYSVAEKLVQENITDYCALCRPLVREPDLVNRWRSGDVRKADCLSDNRCFKEALEGRGLHCIMKGR